MPRFARTQRPPREVAAELAALGRALDAAIPAKALDRNLLVATWNVRAFGGLTERWAPRPGDSPLRSLADVHAIADVLSRFDVVAVQEIRGDLTALRRTLGRLGEHWGLILTDVTRGDAGNDERLGFVYDTRRVTPSGLACELVVPQEELDAGRISEDALREQFARTPYAVSFRSAGHAFTLVTLHVLFGDKPRDRLGELRCIAAWLARWARDADQFGENLITLGDFNIDRRDDPSWQAFTEHGLHTPPELDELPRARGTLGGKATFYDQIAWFQDRLSLAYTGQAGAFDWTPHYLTSEDRVAKTWRMSDHLPLWTEFAVRVGAGATPRADGVPVGVPR